jgi:ubiquinone biosynthesis protein
MKVKSKRTRVGEIIAVFIKHGIKKGFKGSIDPVNVRLAFEELGPTFVKIGQMLSTRPDMIPPAYLKEFQKLQDDVGPERYEDIKKAIEVSLHSPLEQLFLQFDEEAIASASMAEVHKARLLDGENVVVKIQRPKAKETILNDIAILRTLGRFYGFIPLPNFINIKDILDEIEENTRLELDFLNEAKNISRFHENNKDIKCITTPKVYGPYTTSNILVMQYIEGIKIDNINALEEEGYDRHDIGMKLADNYIKQILEDGFFHADPHPGNVMVSGNKIAYVDFGLMGSLDKVLLDKLNNLIRGVATSDVAEITKAIMQIGTNNGPIDTERLFNDVDELFNKYISAALNDLHISEIVNEIFKVCIKNNIVIPREMMMLGKGLLIIESVLAKVSPEISIMNIAVNYGARHVFKGKDARREVSELIRNLYQFSASGVKIPARLLKLIDTIQVGKLTVKIDDQRRDKRLDRLSSIVNRVILGLIVSSLIIGSSIVIIADAGPKTDGVSSIAIAGYVAAAILGLALIISIYRSSRS